MRQPKLSIIRVAIFAVALLVLNQQTLFAQDKVTKIQEVLTLAHKYRQFNGTALVAQDGKVMYKGAFGMANMEWSIPNTPDTKFRHGSITKQFTATLILQLVEKGKIKLDAKIIDYLPDYRKDTGQKVTIHHLLTHTSGIPSYTSLPNFANEVSRDPYKPDEFVKKFASGDLEFEPGSKFAYNNSGYILLGAIIEKVTGKTYEQVLKENILDPTGMKNTGYDHHRTILSKRATGYDKRPDGYTNAPYLDMSLPYAAGSMYSTVEDLLLWDQALYTEKVLSAKSKELMYTPFLEKYAYGWAVEDASFKFNDQPVQSIAHGGGINGFATMIARFPKEKYLIVLLDNTGQSMDPLAEKLARVLYAQPYELPKMSIVDTLSKTINEKGIDAGVAQYREMQLKNSAEYDFGEPELNTLGYILMRSGKLKEALEIFKLNVFMYPKASNPYDSLGEAYLALNQKELAIENYKKSIELNPKNTNAVEVLKRLERPVVTIDAKTFDAYVGEYQLAPGFVLRVFRDGEKFWTQATGQGALEIFAESETVFSPRAVNAKLTFQKDTDGKVTGVQLDQGGRQTIGKKIK